MFLKLSLARLDEKVGDGGVLFCFVFLPSTKLDKGRCRQKI